MKRELARNISLLLLLFIFGCVSKEDQEKKATMIMNQGEELMMKKDDAGAKAKYEKIIKSYPESKAYPVALIRMGNFSRQDKDFTKAFYYFQKVCDDRPGTPEAESATLSIGNIYDGQGNFPKAIEYYRKVIKEYSGKGPEYKYTLRSAIMLLSGKEMMEMSETYKKERASSPGPENPMTIFAVTADTYYINTQKRNNYLLLKKNGTFMISENNMTIEGTYRLTPSTLLMDYNNSTMTGMVDGDNIVDNDNMIWSRCNKSDIQTLK